MQKLRFGLIGMGRFGINYLRLLLQTEGVELVAVASKNSISFDRIKNILPASVKKTTDPNKIIADKNIDCVVIATPPSSHFSLASAAIENEKNVLLEKPMTTNIEDAKKLRKIIKKVKKLSW